MPKFFLILLIPLVVTGPCAAEDPIRPAWSQAVGTDTIGPWSDLQIGANVQRFRWIPPGVFTMGLSMVEKQAILESQRQAKIEYPGFPSEPQRQVTISTGFWMADSVVTRGQWHVVMGGYPKNDPEIDRATMQDSYPATFINWDDATAFLTKLGRGAKLPSDAQWEYACRAGSTGPLYGTLGDIAWFKNNSGGVIHPVRQKQANVWGLYDMLGNASQWCADWYNIYSADPAIDPTGPTRPVYGTMRLLRGCNFGFSDFNCHVGYRVGPPPDMRSPNIGFRISFPAVTRP